MFMKPETIIATVEQEPGGRYYAAVWWTRAGGREGGMRLLAGSFQDSEHATAALAGCTWYTRGGRCRHVGSGCLAPVAT